MNIEMFESMMLICAIGDRIDGDEDAKHATSLPAATLNGFYCSPRGTRKSGQRWLLAGSKYSTPHHLILSKMHL
jgi:hypothetical protein